MVPDFPRLARESNVFFSGVPIKNQSIEFAYTAELIIRIFTNLACLK